MEVTNAANVLISTLLLCLSAGVVGVLILFLNNIFSRYWKPINWSLPDFFGDNQTVGKKINQSTKDK